MEKEKRIVKPITAELRLPALQLVEEVFRAYQDEEEGKLVRSLVEEIRGLDRYVPQLELIAETEGGELVGYAMFSRFAIEGRYERELLLLSPVAVKTAWQRRHISRELLEYGFEKARRLGFRAVLVEGNPDNYRARGFRPSYEYGIQAGPGLQLPRPECLMAKELMPGGLEGMRGAVDFSYYKSLG